MAGNAVKSARSAEEGIEYRIKLFTGDELPLETETPYEKIFRTKLNQGKYCISVRIVPATLQPPGVGLRLLQGITPRNVLENYMFHRKRKFL